MIHPPPPLRPSAAYIEALRLLEEQEVMLASIRESIEISQETLLRSRRLLARASPRT